MTAAAMEGDRETCLAAGMDDYITKPVRLDAIADSLGRWLAPDRGPGRPGDPDQACVDRAGRVDPIDQSQIELLRSLDDGDGTLLARIIDQFAAEGGHAAGELADAVSRGECRTIERTAHTIKGASANVGATDLTEVCAAIEACGRQADLDGAARLIDRFQTEFARAREALSQLTVQA